MITTTSTRVHAIVASPVGRLLLAGREDGTLVALAFADGPRPAVPDPASVEAASPLGSAIAQLEEYFAGARRRFTVPLAPAGTAFQLSVWDALREIPYGATTSYGALAARLGRPHAVRAVGAANGANPIAVIVPCHRVIGASGALTGFAGGLPIKRRLLELEAGIATIV